MEKGKNASELQRFMSKVGETNRKRPKRRSRVKRMRRDWDLEGNGGTPCFKKKGLNGVEEESFRDFEEKVEGKGNDISEISFDVQKENVRFANKKLSDPINQFISRHVIEKPNI